MCYTISPFTRQSVPSFSEMEEREEWHFYKIMCADVLILVNVHASLLSPECLAAELWLLEFQSGHVD